MDTDIKNNDPVNLGKYWQSFKGFLQQRRIYTFLFFLLLSTAFWFIRALGEQYESTVDYPVRYVNFPDNKILVGKVPDELQLTVRSRGFNILKSKLHLDFAPLRFNVNAFSLKSKGADTFFIVTSTVRDMLSEELHDMTILRISPDTLYFKLSGTFKKKVPVVASLSLHNKFFKQQFMMSGRVELSPDSVIITGPGAIIDSIKYVNTEPVSYTNLSDTIKADFLIKPVDLVYYSQQKVTVTIPVDRFTEMEIKQTVIPVNVPDTVQLIAIPGQVSVTYRICISNYQRVKNNPVIPHVNYLDIADKDMTRLNVFLTDTPGYISNLNINPGAIEFLKFHK